MRVSRGGGGKCPYHRVGGQGAKILKAGRVGVSGTEMCWNNSV